MHRTVGITTLLIISAGVLLCSLASAQTARLDIAEVAGSIDINTTTSLEDFRRLLSEGGYQSGSDFIQRTPQDGSPAQYQTEVFVGYDASALHVVFLARDPNPDAIRARMVPRENIDGDDQVTLMLDTDADRRRAYAFRTNPRGVQWDALFTEADGYDVSFDAVWHSDGRVTDWGYVVRMEIPFLSLRFDPADDSRWGIVLRRTLARGTGEDTYWPWVSASVEGTLTQSAELTGLRGISAGRNAQVIPYGSVRSFRILDEAADGGPDFVADEADVKLGADFKMVLHDQYVLDGTINPDFSQVESDEPQITVNQRFEVFFPERRPFFIENADRFRTPITLLFTRRILDPLIGARLTAKTNPWGIGALVVDDRSPGKQVPPESDLANSRAWFTSARVTRDVGEFSTIGAMYAGRELEGTFNRTGGIDGRFRIGSRWALSGMFAGSGTGGGDVETVGALAYTASASRSDRHLFLFGSYTDIARDFKAQAGFVPRTDIRRLSGFSSYFFLPEDKALVSWGPELFFRSVWDHAGVLLDRLVEPSLEWQFVSNTGIEVNYRNAIERLRPEDHASLEGDRRYDVSVWDVEFSTSLLDWLTVDGNYGFGDRINLNPLTGAEPETAGWRRLLADVDFRPLTQLAIENTVIWSRLTDSATDGRIFDDWILRTRWNWQWTRALSLRLILQYEDTSTDSTLTSLASRRNLNVDVLLTYRLNPWTAIYLGANTNARNVDLVERLGDERILTRSNALHQDARQVFLKVSYLIRS